MRRLSRQPFLVAMLLIAPALLLRSVTAAWPFFNNAWLSLHRSNPTLGPDVYIGFDNYRRLFRSTTFQETTEFTILYTVASTILEIAIGLAIALLLNSALRARSIGRAMNLIPWAVPVVVTGIAFRFGLDSSFGLFSDLFTRVTGFQVDWLLDRWPARMSIIFTNVWRNAPFVAVILLAALQTVPEEILEAAKIDGANAVKAFTSISLPLISPVMLSIGVFFLIWQVSSFDLVLSMTGGGPGNSTQVLGYQAYLDAFQSLNFGRSAAMSMVLLSLVAVTGLLGMMLLRRVESRVN
ncbi:MAG: sugar ABC transporter permease [Thermomicrobiales bacterium]|nr:sugar ABC transporter permease [Thermomicrobiales bacterium]